MYCPVVQMVCIMIIITQLLHALLARKPSNVITQHISKLFVFTVFAPLAAIENWTSVRFVLIKQKRLLLQVSVSVAPSLPPFFISFAL